MTDIKQLSPHQVLTRGAEQMPLHIPKQDKNRSPSRFVHSTPVHPPRMYTSSYPRPLGIHRVIQGHGQIPGIGPRFPAAPAAQRRRPRPRRRGRRGGVGGSVGWLGRLAALHGVVEGARAEPGKKAPGGAKLKSQLRPKVRHKHERLIHGGWTGRRKAVGAKWCNHDFSTKKDRKQLPTEVEEPSKRLW